MKIMRVYSGADGESHFEDVDLELRDMDLAGRGHVSRAVEPGLRRSIFVTLD